MRERCCEAGCSELCSERVIIEMPYSSIGKVTSVTCRSD